MNIAETEGRIVISFPIGERIAIAFTIAFMFIACVVIVGLGVGVIVNRVQHLKFCQKYQIDDEHTEFYRNNSDEPVLAHVATYETFSGEREQSVIVPPGQVRYFGHGKVLWVDSE